MSYAREYHNAKADIDNRRANRASQFEPDRKFRIGEVFEVDGSIYVPNTGESRVWVHEFFQDYSQAQAIKGEVNVVAGSPVELTRYPKNPKIWRIMGIYTGDIDPFTVNIAVHATGPHWQNHNYPSESSPGTDPGTVHQPAMQQLKSMANGADLDISVSPLTYSHNNLRKYFPGDVVDLTSSVPLAGNVRKVLIYLDKTTNTIGTVDGTQVLNNGVIPIPYPAKPATSRTSAFYTLIGGQTLATQSTDYEDFRDFTADVIGDIPAPTEVGQILISNGAWWIAATPMVDEDDNIMIDENKQIMYEG